MIRSLHTCLSAKLQLWVVCGVLTCRPLREPHQEQKHLAVLWWWHGRHHTRIHCGCNLWQHTGVL